MTRFKAFIHLILGSSILFLYGNCNGVPYGGLIPLPPGKYFPANKVCSGADQDYIEFVKTENSIGAKYIIPCEDFEEAVNPLDVLISTEDSYIVYKEAAFAFEETQRALHIDNYLAACRTTESQSFSEFLVYKTVSGYVLERVWVNPKVKVEAFDVTWSGVESIPYVFAGDGVRLELRPRENPDRIDFTGSFNGEVNNLICDNLSGVPASEW